MYRSSGDGSLGCLIVLILGLFALEILGLVAAFGEGIGWFIFALIMPPVAVIWGIVDLLQAIF